MIINNRNLFYSGTPDIQFGNATDWKVKCMDLNTFSNQCYTLLYIS